MRINQNIAAYNSFRNLSATNTQLGKSLEKLSSSETGGTEKSYIMIISSSSLVFSLAFSLSSSARFFLAHSRERETIPYYVFSGLFGSALAHRRRFYFTFLACRFNSGIGEGV